MASWLISNVQLKIIGYRTTKKGNIAFQTQYGEFFLDLTSEKCRSNFLRYFPGKKDRVKLMIERGFRADDFIGMECYGYPIIEPLRVDN